MSRLRATLSTDPLDKAVSTKMGEAQRSLVAALRLCDEAERKDAMIRRRLANTRRDLLRALDALTAIRRVAPLYDVTDPDLSDTPKPRREKEAAPPPVDSVGQGE